MIYYVNQAMLHDGDGSLGTPFRRISEAAKIAKPGDEVLVFPGVYREYVNPERGGSAFWNGSSARSSQPRIAS